MKHLRTYKVFENVLGDIESGIHDFWSDMNQKFDDFDQNYQNNIAYKTKDGSVVDTGLGWLIGTAGSLVTGIAQKLFSKNDFFAKKVRVKDSTTGLERDATDAEMDKLFPKDDKGLTPVHQRLLNNNFIERDLPKINNKSEMQNYMKSFYEKAGVKRGQVPYIDKVADQNVGAYLKKSGGMKILPKAIKSESIGAEIAGALESGVIIP